MAAELGHADASPSDASADSGLRLLFRLVVFVIIVFVGYLAVRQITYVIFDPGLELVSPVLPKVRVAANVPLVVGAHVANHGWSDGAAFALVALSSGDYIEGRTVDVPAGDTVFLPVTIQLARGTHTFALIIYDAWRGVREIKTFHGVTIRSVDRKIELDSTRLPSRLRRGAANVIELRATNFGTEAETVVPVVTFHSSSGAMIEVEGEVSDIAGGATEILRIELKPSSLPAGRYVAEASARSGRGEMLGHARYPEPVVVN